MPWKMVKRPDFKGLNARIKKQERKAVDWYLDEAIKQHEKIVGNWEHQPDFIKNITTKGAVVKGQVTVVDDEAGEIWKRVNNGTGIYAGRSKWTITPKKPGGVLSFNLGYKPKTTRRSHGGPGTATGPRVFATEVVQKGIEGRRFDTRVVKLIIRKHAGKFFNFMKKALRR